MYKVKQKEPQREKKERSGCAGEEPAACGSLLNKCIIFLIFNSVCVCVFK